MFAGRQKTCRFTGKMHHHEKNEKICKFLLTSGETGDILNFVVEENLINE